MADLATRIFGTTIAPHNVIGETLRRATAGEVNTADLTARLGQPAPTTWEELHRDPLAVWVEEKFGLDKDDEGKLARQTPKKLSTAATELSELTGVDEKICTEQLRGLLLTGSQVRDTSGRPLFAFKLHQFIGKGDTVYTTLESPTDRYLTTQYQRSAPTGQKGRPLFPLAFCRECGQDFLVVNLDKAGRSSAHARSTTPVEQAEATGLMYLSDGDWPSPTDPTLLNRIPEDLGDRRRRQPHLRQGASELLTGPLPRRSVRHDHRRRRRRPAGRLLRTSRLLPIMQDQLRGVPSSRSSPAWPAWAPRAGPARSRCSPSQSCASSGTKPTSTTTPGSSWPSPTTGRTPACRPAYFNDFVLVGLVRSALHRAAKRGRSATPTIR